LPWTKANDHVYPEREKKVNKKSESQIKNKMPGANGEIRIDALPPREMDSLALQNGGNSGDVGDSQTPSWGAAHARPPTGKHQEKARLGPKKNAGTIL